MAPLDPWDRRAEEFGDHPWRVALKWGVGIIALFAVLAVVLIPITGIISWGSEAKRITGPDNTREQYTEIIRDKTDMDQAVGNVCSIVRAGVEHDDADPLLVESPTLAYEGTYRRAKADYDRRMENAFEGGLIRKYTSLGDAERFPSPAPTLEARLKSECQAARP